MPLIKCKFVGKCKHMMDGCVGYGWFWILLIKISRDAWQGEEERAEIVQKETAPDCLQTDRPPPATTHPGRDRLARASPAYLRLHPRTVHRQGGRASGLHRHHRGGPRRGQGEALLGRRPHRPCRTPRLLATPPEDHHRGIRWSHHRHTHTRPPSHREALAEESNTHFHGGGACSGNCK